MKTSNAKCAAAIRKELKQAFPRVKFYVTSSSVSMGYAVDVIYEDAVLTKDVKNIIEKNVIEKNPYGRFNGLEDIYEYINRRDDTPRVTYAMVHRSFGLEDKKAVATKLAEKFQVATVEDFVNNKMVRISEDYYLYSSDEISKEFNKTIF